MSDNRSGAWIVDESVRALATACADRGRAWPEAGAVLLDAATITLRLTTPDEDAPPGWTVREYGRAWQAPLRWSADVPIDDRLGHPYPLLVSLGDIGGARLLVNLAAAGGVIGVDGDPELARGLLRAWARRLTTGPWAAGTRVIRVGLPPDRGFTGTDVSRPAEAGPVLDDGYGGILLFGDRPRGGDAEQVRRLLDEVPQRWVVAVAGAEHPAWRFTVRPDGSIDTGLFAEPVSLRV